MEAIFIDLVYPRTISNVGVSIKDIVHERAWVRTNAFAVGVRILAETRNRKHSKELFKLMRESYGEVEIIGYYDSPEDYVAGNLQNDKFAHVEEEAPFEGNMNIQYNVDRLPSTDAHSNVAKLIMCIVQAANLERGGHGRGHRHIQVS